MVTKISGNATIPDFYVADNGVIVRLRPEDIIRAVDNSRELPVTYVDKHEDATTDDLKGVVTSMTSDGSGLYFEAVLTDSQLEAEITEKYNSGVIPNVSPRIVPADNAEYTKHHTTSGYEYVTTDDWIIKNISNVEVGRCKPEDGCGVFGYTMSLSETPTTIDNCSCTMGTNTIDFGNVVYSSGTTVIGGADMGTDVYRSGDYIYSVNSVWYEPAENTIKDSDDIMADEPCIKTQLKDAEDKVEALELQLKALETKNADLETQLVEMKSEKDGMELVLSETKGNLEILAKREYDETVKAVLTLDEEYPLKGTETKEELELVLTALRRSSERRKGLMSDRTDEVVVSATDELKKLTGRIH